MHSSSDSGKLCIISSYQPNRRRNSVISYDTFGGAYQSYQREVDYREINAAITYTNYHCPADQGTSTSKPSLGTTPTLRNTTSTK